MILLLSFPHLVDAQPRFREAPNQQLPDFLNKEEAEILFQNFISTQSIGSFIFECEIEYRPYRSKTKSYHAIMVGDWNHEKRITRIDLYDNSGNPYYRFLFETSQENTKAYKWSPDLVNTTPINSSEFEEDLSKEIRISAFSFLMPFLFWDNSTYLGSARTLGRPIHLFSLKNPDENNLFSEVKLSIDEDFFALLESTYLDDEGNALRQFKVRSIGKVSDRWIAKHWSISNLQTKDSFHIKVTRANFNKSLEPSSINAEGLSKKLP